MKILYYCWEECTSYDIIDVFTRKGYDFEIFKASCADKMRDAVFSELLRNKLRNAHYDCIFTFNFFPVISKVADAEGIKYVSWTFDSPSVTLNTHSVLNSCNYIFTFDKTDALKIQNYGALNVFHMPLAVNTHKINALLKEQRPDYKYDVSFMGNTYNNQFNFYDRITNMPEYCKGFFDGIMQAQMNIYGYDFASNIITEDFAPIIDSFANFNLDEEFYWKNTDFFINMLHKKINSTERHEVLQLLADLGIDIHHFAEEENINLNGVKFHGYVDYNTEMPLLFNESRINLNISSRSILSGIPLRCMDVMGAGGFLLSNYQPELIEFFTVGKDFAMYSGRSELVENINYYLNNDEERITIAANAKKRIESEFSYDIVIEQIFKLAGLI